MVTERRKAVLLFGAPGVGKGTQGRILGQIPGFFHLSSGDVFRSIDIESPEGQEIYKYSSRGELVPDELSIRIWKQGLDARATLSMYKPNKDILILDGIPRNVRQAEILEQYIDVLKVLHLTCSDEEKVIHRIRHRAIRENRADDANESVIRRRFEVYREESAQVLSCYPKEIISNIDAIGSPAGVLFACLESLVPVQDAHFRGE
ncbi:nucleoside monophosphate kinase [uncultured Gimesia sp.]|uniref:adenylate kinase family protein n=1 Tax=uncultured Gimesia sp. TaxID=1678688 RepID=UPI00262FF1FE|nr:nucleoside monophosphate kinase [uncultured Gimesia sp.]